MGLFDELYKPYNQVVSQPVLPTGAMPQPTPPPAPTPPIDPLHALLTSLLTQKATSPSGFDFAGLLKALRNDPVGDANRTNALPSYAPGSTSPFLTGFFDKRQPRY